MITRNEYLAAIETVKSYERQCRNDLKEISRNKKSMIINDSTMVDKEIYYHCSGVNSRLINTIINNRVKLGLKEDYNEIIYGDLENVSLSDFAKCRNVGKKTVIELMLLCKELGIKLKQ